MIIDADEVARELTRPGTPLVERIKAEFGSEFVREDGRLDRRKLAKAVFGDPAATARLNAIAHPPILTAIDQKIAELGAEGKTQLICLVAPLLLEVGEGRGRRVDRVLVMVADEEERVRRVVERDRLTPEEVRERMAAQMPAEEQRRRADWVVDTTGGRESARRRLDAIWSELNRR